MSKKIEHRIVNNKKVEEEHRTVFLDGYYSLLDADIKKLEENKILITKTENDEKK